MVLITPLKIEVQEDPASGRVRANVLDTVKGGYRPEVHVKAIGSADTGSLRRDRLARTVHRRQPARQSHRHCPRG